MTPSRYQQDFYDALAEGGYDIQLCAVAGSGKTLSLQEGISRLPWEVHCGTLMTAFNAHIKAELASRQADGRIPSDVTISTIHGLGYQAIRRHLQPRDTRNWVDDKKYQRLANHWWQLRSPHVAPGNGQAAEAARAAIRKVACLAMLTLTDSKDPDALMAMADRYGLEVPAGYEEDVTEGTCDVVDWGAVGAPEPDGFGKRYHPSEAISFDDMIWLPLRVNCGLPEFDLVMVDEQQDLNRCQQELLMRTRAPGGRMVFVGDPRQAVYGFAGADYESFDRMAQVTNARRMPLSICYRCAKEVVKYAQVLVPEIEAFEGAPDGVVRLDAEEGDLLEEVREHYRSGSDEHFMILCRINAPLVGAALWLIRQGVPARVRGRDIGAQLESTLKRIASIEGFQYEALPHFADVYRTREAQALTGRDDCEMALAALDDRVESVVAVWVACCRETFPCLDTLRQRIRDLFDDTEGRTVLLSSVHKAKGLEAERVGILRGDLLPHPRARKPWQIQQEANLEYVAVTRARRELTICPL